MTVEIINPIEYPGWDDLLLTNPETTFFHTSAWAEVLHEAYKYKPLYFVTKEDEKLSSLIAVMEVTSYLTGRRGISLPFTDFCCPIANSEDKFETLPEKMIQYGKRAGWRHLELRGGMNFSEKSPTSAGFVSHSLGLSGGDEQIFNSFRDSTRRNIKKAVKESIQIAFEDSWSSLETFLRLNAITRKHHGLPPQPKSFFKKVFEHVIAKDKGIVLLAYYKETAIAGAVFFYFGDQAIYKYGASDRKYLNLRANNLVMWEAIKWFVRNGFVNLSFGRTDPENIGLLQFKRGWGTRERRIYYYFYDFRLGGFIAQKNGFKSTYGIFKLLPVPLLKLSGKFLYRHVG